MSYRIHDCKDSISNSCNTIVRGTLFLDFDEGCHVRVRLQQCCQCCERGEAEILKAFSEALRECSRQVTECFRVKIEKVCLDAAETGQIDIMAEKWNAVGRKLDVSLDMAAACLEHCPVSLYGVLGEMKRGATVADPQDISVWRNALHGSSIIESVSTRDRVSHLDKQTASMENGAQMVANRLRKNMRNLSRWLRDEEIHCYRLYDADIPEYAVAVDVYESDRRLVHVQEYAPPKSVDPAKAERRLGEALDAVKEALGIGNEQLFVKVRRQQKGASQYEKFAASGEFHEVVEGGCRLLVNLRDYLDTGLFLDHRITRSMLAKLAQGRRFLNLFAYTGAGTVHASKGGASATLTIDMSKTYLEWAKRNMALNGFTGREHVYKQANCVDWLEKASPKQKFGVIFLDPPSFSTSKRMKSVFDVQRDHVMLIRHCMKILEPDGVLVFSNNLRRFRMDFDALSGFSIEDISRETLPRDFERNPRIHNCWKITF